MTVKYKRFVQILMVAFGATLLPIFILNLILLNDTLGNSRKVILASQWQQKTHGVTYAPTLSDTHLFKTLRLNDRLAEINTVVFGSSTALGITQQAFPETLRVYNYAQTGRPLNAVIGDAEYVQLHAPQVKWLVIPLDWSLGFIYQAGSVPEADLSAATAMRQAESSAHQIPLMDRIRDALSYPRVASLMEISMSILGAKDKVAAFKGYFLQDGSDDYTCADGVMGKDFDSIYRGSCTGFRFDGSATFANSSRVVNASPLILSAVMSSSKYRQNLESTGGIPNAQILQRLAALATRARENGGGVILFMPPLLPGMDAEFQRHAQLAANLARTKNRVNDWARQHHLAVVDFGQSERFKCRADEFLDEHHAVASCYEKIFDDFWSSSLQTDGSIKLPDDGLL